MSETWAVTLGSLEDAEAFRVLVVDDEQAVRDNVTRQIRALQSVVVVGAATQAAAEEALQKHWFDVAIVDLELDTRAGGNEILNYIAENRPATSALVATKHVDPQHLRSLFGLAFSDRIRMLGIIDKVDPPREWALASVEPVYQEWLSRPVALEGLDLALDGLLDRSSRIHGLWSDRGETEIELRRLFGDLFGRIATLHKEGCTVKLVELERQGLSPAVTLEAQLTMGTDESGQPIRGNRCVVKIGPKRALREEFMRFEQFVRYGVRLAHRVELLGYTDADVLGGIVYSFAGGVFSDEITALDELLHSDASEAIHVIGRLFDPSSKNWYDVDAGSLSPLDYFQQEYECNFSNAYVQLHNSIAATLEKLRRKATGGVDAGLGFREAQATRDGYVEVGSLRVSIPMTQFRGYGLFMTEQVACFAHGDMHGGNVLVERHNVQTLDPVSQEATVRICLIDFQNAGPAPRVIDAIALEASVRLAHAKQICEEALLRAELESNVDPQVAGIEMALRAEQQELGLLRQLWLEDTRAFTSDDLSWRTVSASIAAGVRSNFDSCKLTEYMSVGMLYALRLLGHDLDIVERVRLLSWMSAQYKLLRRVNAFK